MERIGNGLRLSFPQDNLITGTDGGAVRISDVDRISHRVTWHHGVLGIIKQVKGTLDILHLVVTQRTMAVTQL